MPGFFGNTLSFIQKLRDEKAAGQREHDDRFIQGMGIDQKPASGDGGWFHHALSVAEARTAESKQLDKDVLERGRKLAIDDGQGDLAPAGSSYSSIPQKYLDQARKDLTEKNAAPAAPALSGMGAQRSSKPEDPLHQWISSADAYRLVTHGDPGAKVDYDAFRSDPYKFLSDDANIREANYGLDTPGRSWLQQKGVPDFVISGLHQYIKDNPKQYKGQAGGTSEGNPIARITGDVASGVFGEKTGNIVGDLAQGVSDFNPILGPAQAGAGGTNTNLDRDLAKEAAVSTVKPVAAAVAGPVGGGIVAKVARRPFMEGVGKTLAGHEGAKLFPELTEAEKALSPLAKFGARTGSEAAVNAAIDAPVTATQLIAAGITPDDPRFYRYLGQNAALSGGAGAGFGALGGGLHAATGIHEPTFTTPRGEHIPVSELIPESIAKTGPALKLGAEAGIGAGVGAGVAEATGNDPSEGAKLGALLPLAAQAPRVYSAIDRLTEGGFGGSITKNAAGLDHTELKDFHVGQEVYGVGPGSFKGIVEGINGATGDIRVRSAGSVYNLPHDMLLSQGDKLKVGATAARAKALLNVTPDPAQVTAATDEIATAQEGAGALNNSEHKTASALGPIGRVADPASQYNTPFMKGVFDSVTAAANYMRSQLPNVNRDTKAKLKALDPFGVMMTNGDHLKRAGAQLTAAGAPVALGFGASAVTGDDKFKEAGILGGLAAMATISHAQTKKGFMEPRPWEGITTKIPKDPDIPEWAQKGNNKLAHIIENPEKYDLTPEQALAIPELQKARIAQLKYTNSFKQAAGMPLVPELEGNVLFHAYTPESVEKAGLGAQPSATHVRTPGFSNPLPIEKQRELGSFEEAINKHPELEIAGSVPQLLREEAVQQANIRSRAVLVKGIKDIPGASLERPDLDAILAKGGTEADFKLAMQNWNDLTRNEHWGQVPGIDDHIFHPNVVKAIEKLYITDRGSKNPALSFLDDLTGAVRQALFVGDASAWTMQGAMTALENPMSVIRNAHHLIGATFGGDAYFNHWLSDPKNEKLWKDFTLSGGNPQREHGGLENLIENPVVRGLALSNKPGIEKVEENGFGAFLPIHRALMWKTMNDSEALIRKAGLNRVPGARLAADAVKLAPAIGAYAAVQSDNQIDVPLAPDWLDKAFTLALGVGAGVALQHGSSVLGEKASSKLSDAELREMKGTTARQINRISGTLNRQSAGIGNQQSLNERLLVRSPALMRNTLSLAKLALTDYGPDGALARTYLVKTAMLIGTGLAALKYFETGQSDSFDPADENSVFSPSNLLRADTGRGGSISPSNPAIALVRAAIYQDRPAGEQGFKLDNLRPDIGFKNWLEGRLADTTSVGTKPIIDNIHEYATNAAGVGPGIPNPDSPPAQSGVIGAVSTALSHFSPVSVQQANETGLLGKTAIGGALGLTGNPNYNNGREKWNGMIGGFLGANANPETLGHELTSRKDEAAHGLGYDPNALNREENGQVKTQLAGDPGYVAAQQAIDDAHIGQPPTPIQKYLDSLKDVSDRYLASLQGADASYKKTNDAFTFKKAYSDLQAQKRTELDQAKRDLANASAGMRGRSESVDQWLSRNLQPEDRAVNDYYELFNKATPPGGKLDFDQLQKLQDDFMAKLDPNMRGYVERMTAQKPTDIKGLQDYRTAKDAAKPYFDMRDAAFKQVAPGDPVLSQFGSLSEFNDFTRQLAAQQGLSQQQVEQLVLAKSPGYRAYMRQVTPAEVKMRMGNLGMDTALMDWYGYSPKNKANIIASAHNLRGLVGQNLTDAADYGLDVNGQSMFN